MNDGFAGVTIPRIFVIFPKEIASYQPPPVFPASVYATELRGVQALVGVGEGDREECFSAAALASAVPWEPRSQANATQGGFWLGLAWVTGRSVSLLRLWRRRYPGSLVRKRTRPRGVSGWGWRG